MSTRQSGKGFSPPEYCDFTCPKADFGNPNVAGACRRDIAVWCVALQRYNAKHARCLLRGSSEGENSGNTA
jgi:hypothetical protein